MPEPEKAPVQKPEVEKKPDPKPEPDKPEAEKSSIVASDEKAEAAARKLRIIAVSYSQTAPDSHVLFGAAGTIFTLGDIRDLFGLPRL